ncbi:type III-B CRISPR module RAMP protein Cmr1 [Halomonas qaidamensis]|uniref:Type III-B CRISPR module RAMP protein Cmr1 n=1 Tax=Halomonas qaidamensis TaxID=2866211 RepID=A0ABY6JSF4_9GAMM|nr:type III-B CRISPR module RAMP protein Cmr1 [Halomonas qaidamensis]UYV19459.1 type III-B CRISPR module RAMP protein Cmr1 [Halomonas qaidamensis]
MNDTVNLWGKALAQQQRTLRAELVIVTPMFIGDGTQQANSVRASSIKGALRFWWRALNWGRMLEVERGSVENALRRLYRAEARLFGLAAKGKKVQEPSEGGQGLFRLSVEQSTDIKTQNSWPMDGNSQGGYLGYGLWATRSSEARKSLEEGAQFTLTLSFKSGINQVDLASQVDIDQMRQAVSLWGLLGGLGSRARRGFGSVALQVLDGQTMTVNSSQEYAARLKAALEDGPWPAALSDTPFTAWSQQTRCLMFAPALSGRQAIGNLERPYKDVRKELKGIQKAVFGLPLAGHDNKNRRASPFIMHVHPVGEQYLPVVTYLPANFHHAYPNNPLNDAQSLKPLEMFFEHSKGSLL